MGSAMREKSLVNSLVFHGKREKSRKGRIGQCLQFPNLVIVSAVGRRNTQKSANAIPQKNAKERKRAQRTRKKNANASPQKSANKERFRGKIANNQV